MSKIRDFFEDVFTDKELEKVTLEKERLEDNVIRRIVSIQFQLDRIEGNERKILEELSNVRNSGRDINENENKRTRRGRPKKVRTD